MLALGLVVGVPTGEPSPSVPTIRWDAPSSCPSVEAFEARIPDPSAERWADVSAHVRVSEPRGGGYGLEITLRTAAGYSTRQAQAQDCEVLADAAALILLTFVEPIAVVEILDAAPVVLPTPTDARRPGASEPTSPPPRPVRRGTAVVEPVAPPPSPRARTEPDRFGVRAGAALGQATLPGLDVGPTLALGWQRGLLRLDAMALALLPRRRTFEERPEVGLRLWMTGGALSGGLTMPISDHLELPLGVGVEVATVVATGRGVSRPRTIVRPWVAAFGAAHLVWRPTPRWGLWLGVASVVGLARPSFTVSDQGPVAVGAGGFRGMLSVEWAWAR